MEWNPPPPRPIPRMMFFCANNLVTSSQSVFHINVRVINYQHARSHIPLLAIQLFSPDNPPLPPACFQSLFPSPHTLPPPLHECHHVFGSLPVIKLVTMVKSRVVIDPPGTGLTCHSSRPPGSNAWGDRGLGPAHRSSPKPKDSGAGGGVKWWDDWRGSRGSLSKIKGCVVERRSSLSRNLSSLTEPRIDIDEPTIECHQNTEKENCEHSNSNTGKLVFICDSGH